MPAKKHAQVYIKDCVACGTCEYVCPRKAANAEAAAVPKLERFLNRNCSGDRDAADAHAARRRPGLKGLFALASNVCLTQMNSKAE